MPTADAPFLDSPASHSGVKNQAWSVGMDTKPRTVTVPSSWTENSTSTPPGQCAARLMYSGSPATREESACDSRASQWIT
jgi:hypothetical protein